MSVDAYAQVPSAAPDAEVDPHWLELRGASALPAVYLPPSMPGRHSRRTRVMAVALIGVFLLATVAGVCLTYGPKAFGL